MPGATTLRHSAYHELIVTMGQLKSKTENLGLGHSSADAFSANSVPVVIMRLQQKSQEECQGEPLAVGCRPWPF